MAKILADFEEGQNISFHSGVETFSPKCHFWVKFQHSRYDFFDAYLQKS